MDRLAELKQLDKELAQLEKLKRTHKILFYTPIGNQPKFHGSTARNRYLFGSNRSGKSVAGHNELIACAVGYRPWLPKDHPDHIVRLGNGEPIPVPNVGAHLLENLSTSGKQIFIRKMEEWLPKEWGTVKKNNQGQPVQVLFKNGSVIHVFSQNMDIDALEGIDIHYLSCDEPPAPNFWTALKRGVVDHDGIAWISATPLKASYFMAELMEMADKDTSHENHELITLSIHDNRVSRGGYLPDKAVDLFIASLPPDEIEARVYGRPKHLSGAVYKEWMPTEPYYIPEFKIPLDWPRVMAIDPAEQKPIAAVWIAISPDNKHYVYRDLYDSDLRTTRQFADRVKELEGWKRTDDGHWYATDDTEPVVLRISDTSGRKTERSSGYSIISALQLEDLTFINADKTDFIGGIDRVRQMITYDPQYEWSLGPQLQVFNCCVRVKYEMMNYVWQPKSVQARKSGADPSDKPLSANNDCLDCIRYIAVLILDYSSLKGLQSQLGF